MVQKEKKATSYASFAIDPATWGRFKEMAQRTGTSYKALLESMVAGLISDQDYPSEAAGGPETMRAVVADLSPETAEAVRREAARRGVRLGHVYRLAIERGVKGAQPLGEEVTA